MNTHSYAENMQLLDGVLIMATGSAETSWMWLLTSSGVSFINSGRIINNVKTGFGVDIESSTYIWTFGLEETPHLQPIFTFFYVSCGSSSWEVWG